MLLPAAIHKDSFLKVSELPGQARGSREAQISGLGTDGPPGHTDNHAYD